VSLITFPVFRLSLAGSTIAGAANRAYAISETNRGRPKNIRHLPNIAYDVASRRFLVDGKDRSPADALSDNFANIAETDHVRARNIQKVTSRNRCSSFDRHDTIVNMDWVDFDTVTPLELDRRTSFNHVDEP
jgi:hypothetical protein